MGPIGNPPVPAVAFAQAELSSSISQSSQTLSPDAKVLSILLSGLSAHAEGGGPRGATVAGTLTVPLTGVSSSVFVKVTIRGEATVGSSDASGRLYIELNGFTVGSGFSDPGATIQQELSLQLSPSAPVIVLNLLVSCQAFGTEANASALVSLDSIDLSLQ